MRALSVIYADIIANPEDQRPRIEFADACEFGDPTRSRYIRAWLAYHSYKYPGPEPRISPREIWPNFTSTPFFNNESDLEAQWAEELTALGASSSYHKGFVMSVALYVETFLRDGAEVFNKAPLRHLQLSPYPPSDGGPSVDRFPLAQVMASPLLERLDTLSIKGGRIDRADLDAVLDSPHLGRIKGLEIAAHYTDMTEGAWDAVAASPTLRAMIKLDIPARGYPGESTSVSEDPRIDYVANPVTPHGRKLEKKYGYIPWLHLENQNTDKWHISSAMATKSRPRYAPGTKMTRDMWKVEQPRKRDTYW